MKAGGTVTDVLVVGGGPSGVALAAEVAARNLTVRVVAPHAPQPFPATYGAWLDDLPEWARGSVAHAWSDVRVHAGRAVTPLLRPYALLENAQLLSALLGRAEPGGLWWDVGRVVGAQRDAGVWRVHSEGGRSWRARVVVDASGHGGTLRRVAFRRGAALQTAYGLVGRFRVPPSAPGAMVWMDYRHPHLPGGAFGAAPSFLYAMHLGGDVYFVEETSLVARPALSVEALRARLRARLEAQGTPCAEVLSTEVCAFPMNAPAPDAGGGLLAFGAAGGLVQPVSGFQVAGALADAPLVADALAAHLPFGPDAASRAGWAALWPAARRETRAVQLLGVEALLGLPGAHLPAFFEAFFALPAAQWRAFLAPRTPAGELARIMLRLFARAPMRVRAPLARAACTAPGVSARALARAALPILGA
ncbi:lycopene cyclase family protein [Deinococcus maricopensis]|uniref:Lycopene cyclase family protein n=1 Tax=Deinococcus maricopensis (strain DSM 21211 / LMG 22137 / NRRL B-23946 / LB-34) TaxID=709986 RepID=E8U839_DEIML|nr:lycopene cyclase family protein [Deinococcus maricopensis]ADV67228.1 lycopene cyclase family protein [Deinococcus maricopensis DSM 21211]